MQERGNSKQKCAFDEHHSTEGDRNHEVDELAATREARPGESTNDKTDRGTDRGDRDVHALVAIGEVDSGHKPFGGRDGAAEEEHRAGRSSRSVPVTETLRDRAQPRCSLAAPEGEVRLAASEPGACGGSARCAFAP